MKEVIITYKNNKTIDALKDLGKYLGFIVTEKSFEKRPKTSFINGVSIIEGDNAIDISELHSIFTGKKLDASELRNSEWKRKK